METQSGDAEYGDGIIINTGMGGDDIRIMRRRIGVFDFGALTGLIRVEKEDDRREDVPLGADGND